VVVEMQLWGPAETVVAEVALDTGASTSMVSEALLRFIGYDPTTAPQRVQITTGSGVVAVPLLPVAQVQALGQVRQSFPILCHTLPPTATIDGLLGLDFIRGLCLTLDFRAGQITWA
jgi:hypothetical protein